MEWVVTMAASDAVHLAPCRTRPGWQVALAGSDLWLRLPQTDPEARRWLDRLPCRHRYLYAGGTLLRLPEATLPVARLPAELEWQELARLLRPAPPEAVGPVAAPAPLSIRLERSGLAREPAGLLLPWTTWAAYGETAPGVRLARLRFALAGDGRVLVLGQPLPPLPGQALVAAGPWLLPAGWTFPQAGDAVRLAAHARLGRGDHGLVAREGTWELIPAESLVPATRSAIRLSRPEPGEASA